jgi:ribosomal protein L7/L12
MEETVKAVVETPAKFKAVVEAIEKMSVLDLHELVKHLEEKLSDE